MVTIKELKRKIEEAKIKEKQYNDFMNEGGEGYYYESPKLKNLREQIYDLEQKEFQAEWTVEKTMLRRSAWNQKTQLLLKKYNNKVPQFEIFKLQETIGFTMADLKKAVDLYKL